MTRSRERERERERELKMEEEEEERETRYVCTYPGILLEDEPMRHTHRAKMSVAGL